VKVKKVLIISFTILTVTLVGFIVALKLVFSGGFLGGDVDNSEEIKVSDLGDNFVFKYEDRNFPDSERAVNVMDATGKEQIAYFVLEEPLEIDILTVIDLPTIRCYEVNGFLLYKVGDGTFQSIDVDRIASLEPNDDPTFVDVAKVLLTMKEWVWTKSCREFLLKEEVDDTRTILERYVNGQFTQEEIELNNSSE
jgi:hypothetical protein